MFISFEEELYIGDHIVLQGRGVTLTLVCMRVLKEQLPNST